MSISSLVEETQSFALLYPANTMSSAMGALIKEMPVFQAPKADGGATGNTIGDGPMRLSTGISAE